MPPSRRLSFFSGLCPKPEISGGLRKSRESGERTISDTLNFWHFFRNRTFFLGGPSLRQAYTAGRGKKSSRVGGGRLKIRIFWTDGKKRGGPGGVPGGVKNGQKIAIFSQILTILNHIL